MKYINKRNTTIFLISILNTFSIHLINCTKYCDSVNVPAQASSSIPGTILMGGCSNLEQFQFGEEGRHLFLIKTNYIFLLVNILLNKSCLFKYAQGPHGSPAQTEKLRKCYLQFDYSISDAYWFYNLETHFKHNKTMSRVSHISYCFKHDIFYEAIFLNINKARALFLWALYLTCNSTVFQIFADH